MSEDRLDRIERLVEANTHAIAVLSQKAEVNEQRWQQQETENRIILERIDAYQRASNQVVNLAFTLVGAATIALVGIVLRLAVTI